MTAEQHIFHLVQALQEAQDSYVKVMHKYDRKCSAHTSQHFTGIPSNEIRVNEIMYSEEFEQYKSPELIQAINSLEASGKIVVRKADNGEELIRVKPL